MYYPDRQLFFLNWKHLQNIFNYPRLSLVAILKSKKFIREKSLKINSLQLHKMTTKISNKMLGFKKASLEVYVAIPTYKADYATATHCYFMLSLVNEPMKRSLFAI